MTSTDKLDKAYSDLTGCFPVQLSRGNNYVLVAFHPDANGILVQPIKNRQAKSILDAWTIIKNRFKKAGVQPSTWILDN